MLPAVSLRGKHVKHKLRGKIHDLVVRKLVQGEIIRQHQSRWLGRQPRAQGTVCILNHPFLWEHSHNIVEQYCRAASLWTA